MAAWQTLCVMGLMQSLLKSWKRRFASHSALITDQNVSPSAPVSFDPSDQPLRPGVTLLKGAARFVVLDPDRVLAPGELVWDARGRLQSLRRTRGPVADVCVLPGLGAEAQSLLAQMRTPECSALATMLSRHVAGGGQVAASCSAVFLLDAAGLLDGRSATTTWWLAPTLARVSPRCRVDADRMVCADGPVITSGAAFAHADLMLHLVRERCGPKLGEAVSRWLLLEHRHAQSPFVIPEVLASGHTLVSKLTARIESALPEVPGIAVLAREFCVCERTLARHVRRATGKSTGGLVQSIRLRRAREVLQQSCMSIDQVAVAVGYQDATALRRLMRRSAGTTPSRLRSSVAVSA